VTTIRAGDLRKRLKIQKRAITQDATGAQVRTWSDVITNTPDHSVWAEITPAGVEARFYAGAEQAGVAHIITVRYRTELTDPLKVAAMRGIYNTRIFSFKAPRDEDERHIFLEIDAVEGMISD
jgi:SPP1 family predicted phage head-tail adaptor